MSCCRLRGGQASLPDLPWWVLILGAVINVAISWVFVAKDLAHQFALTCLVAVLPGALLFLTTAMDNPLPGQLQHRGERLRVGTLRNGNLLILC